MRRRLQHLLSLQAIAHLRYIPLIIGRVKDWPRFLLTYIGFSRKTGVFRLRNGLRIHTDNPDDISTLMVVFIKKEYGRIPSDSVIVDIGANIGMFSLYAATAAKRNKVYAFEPMPQTYSLLQKNVIDNHLGRVIKTVPFGIWKKEGTIKLYLANTSPFHSIYQESRKGKTVDIKVVSLAEGFKRNRITRCDLMKIDCEGAEYDILYNAPDNTLKSIREIRLEYHDLKDSGDTHNFSSLRSFLEKKGFRMIRWDAERSSTGIAWFRRALT